MLSRNLFYDIVKGYAIFLVVLGHVIQCFMPECEKNSIYLFIYSFHMPLFMAVSGYFFLNSVDKVDTITFLKNKFRHLMLPSLTIGAINCLIIGGGKLLIDSSVDVLYLAYLFFTGLWFLNVLFFLSVVGCLFRKFLRNKMYLGWILLMGVLYFCPGVCLVNEIKYLSPFFVGAIALRRLNWENIPIWMTVISVICFCILFTKFDFSMSMYRMSDETLTYNYLYETVFRLLIGAFGCIVALSICIFIPSAGYLGKGLMYIGVMTLPIYVLHQEMLMWNIIVGIQICHIVPILFITILIVLLSIMVYKIMKKSLIVALLLFGEI